MIKVIIKRCIYNDILLKFPEFAEAEFYRKYASYFNYIEKGRTPYPLNWESEHSDGSRWKKFSTGWECVLRPPHHAIERIAETINNGISSGPRNKLSGIEREERARRILEELFPQEAGFVVFSEVILRDSAGHKKKDSVTNSGRKIDFAVIKNGVIKLVEVTSKTADKKNQSAKEKRIRKEGGIFIRYSGRLYDVSKIETEIMRLN